MGFLGNEMNFPGNRWGEEEEAMVKEEEQGRRWKKKIGPCGSVTR